MHARANVRVPFLQLRRALLARLGAQQRLVDAPALALALSRSCNALCIHVRFRAPCLRNQANHDARDVALILLAIAETPRHDANGTLAGVVARARELDHAQLLLRRQSEVGGRVGHREFGGDLLRHGRGAAIGASGHHVGPANERRA